MLLNRFKGSFLLRKRMVFICPHKFKDLFELLDDGVDVSGNNLRSHYFDIINVYEVDQKKTLFKIEDKTRWGTGTMMKIDVKDLDDGSLLEVDFRLNNYIIFLISLVWISAILLGGPVLEFPLLFKILLFLNIILAPYFYSLFVFISDTISYIDFLKHVLNAKVVIED